VQVRLTAAGLRISLLGKMATTSSTAAMVMASCMTVLVRIHSKAGMVVTTCMLETIVIGTYSYFRDIDETVKGSQRDRIFEFDSGEDDIHLRNIDANEDLAGDQNFLFSSDGAAANSVWVKDSGNNILVRGDVNGDTIHDFEIYVASVDDLYVYDFIL
jgi:hypothetical protein